MSERSTSLLLRVLPAAAMAVGAFAGASLGGGSALVSGALALAGFAFGWTVLAPPAERPDATAGPGKVDPTLEARLIAYREEARSLREAVARERERARQAGRMLEAVGTLVLPGLYTVDGILSGLLGEPERAIDRRRALGPAVRELRRLRHLVEELLALAREEEDAGSLTPAPLELRPFLADVCREEGAAEPRVGETVPALVLVDRTRLETALRSLLRAGDGPIEIAVDGRPTGIDLVELTFRLPGRAGIVRETRAAREEGRIAAHLAAAGERALAALLGVRAFERLGAALEHAGDDVVVRLVVPLAADRRRRREEPAAEGVARGEEAPVAAD